MPTSSEPETVFGRAAVAQENVPIGVKRERLSVDEYFDELWSMYLTKRENLQNLSLTHQYNKDNIAFSLHIP